MNKLFIRAFKTLNIHSSEFFIHSKLTCSGSTPLTVTFTHSEFTQSKFYSVIQSFNHSKLKKVLLASAGCTFFLREE